MCVWQYIAIQDADSRECMCILYTLVDQLVCPVLMCKLWLCERDIKSICGEAMLFQFQATLKRK